MPIVTSYDVEIKEALVKVFDLEDFELRKKKIRERRSIKELYRAIREEIGVKMAEAPKPEVA